MTRHSILEYVKAVKPRYKRGSKEAKTKILDEFIATTGLHRKSAIRLLNRPDQSERRKKSGRPRRYGFETEVTLMKVWETSDR